MRTWREVREELMTASKQHFSLLLQGEEAPTYFYRPLESTFNAFDDVMPEEMELICEDEIRMLLCGYQSENIRIQFNPQNNRPQNLTANPSFDPYIRSTIDRYLDIVTDLYTIRVQGHEIRSNLLRSRIARVIVSKIAHRVDDLLNPILMESFVQRQGSADEGFHDSEYGLNGLSRMTGAIKSTLHCYADIVSAIYEKNLCGGEIIDLLEDKYQKAVRDRQELQLLVKEAWKIFFEIAGTWISYGQLEDANREFFVWPTKGIKSVDVELLLKENGKAENGYLLVPELCPKLIRPYMTSIFQCGQNTNSSIQSSLSEWSSLENPSRFIQKISGLTSELSAVVLKQMRNEGRLDEFLQCFFTTMLNSPWLTRISSALVAKDLPDRMYNEVADGVLKSLTHQTLHHDIGYFPLMSNFRFSKDRSNIFDALIRCQYISQSRSSMKTRSESQPTLADRLTISVTMPEGLERVMTPDLIYTYSLIFRLQMRIMLAAITLDEKKSELGRTGMRIGIQDAALRQPLQLLNQMSQYLMKFRLQLFNAVRGALRLFSDRLSKASHVEEVSRLQRDCLTHIFKDGKLTEEHIYIVEDLIGLIQSFAADCTFDQLIESYNLWLESVDSARFLNNEFTAFA